MDKFNYLQPSNNDNDLLAAELVLADDFPTYDFSLRQIVTDFSPNIATVPHGIKSTGTKTKTTTLTQRTRRSSRRFKISRDFKRRYRRAGVCCSKQTYLLLDKTVDECFLIHGAPPAILTSTPPPPPPPPKQVLCRS